MPLTAYCKKCAKDVPVGDSCPICGGKLSGSSVRLAWCVEHTPVRDWMCWNAVMRIAAPVLGLTLALGLVLEGMLRGLNGLLALLTGPFTVTLLALFALLCLATLLVLRAQGADVLDCVIDARGLHVTCYLVSPTRWKLLARFRSPRLMQHQGDSPLLPVAQQDLAWKDVQRVQLWPEKFLLLFYAPTWWLRLALPCTPEHWQEALQSIRDKLGRKKQVQLPPALRVAAPAKTPRKKSAPAPVPMAVEHVLESDGAGEN